MTIRDLLAAESINLNGTPAGKTEALNQCIDLMAKKWQNIRCGEVSQGCFCKRGGRHNRNWNGYSNSSLQV